MGLFVGFPVKGQDGRRQTAADTAGNAIPLASAANCRLPSAVTVPFSRASKMTNLCPFAVYLQSFQKSAHKICVHPAKPR